MEGLAEIRDIGKLTLEQKVGQMILCGFEGTEPSAEAIRGIREHAIGGVLYRARNVCDTAQAAQLSMALQAEAKACGQLPLWIAVDQGGGALARLAEGMALMPGVMAIAAGGNKTAAYKAGSISGRELKALGIHMCLAPVLHESNGPANPRTGAHFAGEGAEHLGDYGVQFLRGLQDAGVAAAAKPLPGCAETDTASADGQSRLDAAHLRPFRQAIEAGVDAILSIPVVEPGKRTEVNPDLAMIRLLRRQLDFEGVIVTHCPELDALNDEGMEHAAVMAVEAGADLIVLPVRHDLQLEALQSLIEAVRKGRISEERIDRSVRRLLALKERYGVFAAFEPDAGMVSALARVGCEAHKETARRISEASTTRVRDEKALLPVSANGSLYVISVETAEHLQAAEAAQAPFTLGRALRQLGCKVTEFLVPQQEVEALRHELVRSVRYGQQVVVATYNAQFDAAQAELIRGLLAVGKEPIVVAQCSPCDLLAFPDISTFVAAYESRPHTLRSAAKVLLGQREATGKLPVAIGTLHAAGSGDSGT
ncbi:Beta-hexosaminidase [Paenibacillus allorhizosphaerae]|uniref:Beta-hexosaminidase n=2 Tax=Paenibacillus allorhizosphaerae TaxID=2849866 RepID=A0ABM8VI52_9BACL|nr:Beta-hexosaminidase [Paenibacillus allorhizosphaerae]